MSSDYETDIEDSEISNAANVRIVSVKAPVKAPLKAPVKAPLKAPVKAPLKAQVKAPLKAPVKAPSKGKNSDFDRICPATQPDPVDNDLHPSDVVHQIFHQLESQSSLLLQMLESQEEMRKAMANQNASIKNLEERVTSLEPLINPMHKTTMSK